MLRVLRPCFVMVAVATLVAASCSDDTDPSEGGAGAAEQEDPGATVAPTGSGEGTLTVGSGTSAESSVLGALYAEALELGGYEVTRRLQYGPRDTYLDALEAGQLDLVPEFAGPLAEHLGAGVGPDAELGEVEDALTGSLPPGLVAFEPSDASVDTALVVTAEVASERDLTGVDDLGTSGAGLVIGGRQDLDPAPPGATFRPLDRGGPLTKEALAEGDVDVAVLRSTDGAIRANDWVVLEGDADLGPPGNALALARNGALDDEARSLVAEVNRTMTDPAFRAVVERVTVRQEDPEEAARDWAEAVGLFESE